MLSVMPVTVILELKIKPECVSTARDVFRRALTDTRAFPGNLGTDVLVDENDDGHWLISELWESVEADEAYRAFRAGEGTLTEVPALLSAPPVKTRYTTSDV
jgi:quinol monooxygenase YgiN